MHKALLLVALGVSAVVGLVILARPDRQETMESAETDERSDVSKRPGVTGSSTAAADRAPGASTESTVSSRIAPNEAPGSSESPDVTSPGAGESDGSADDDRHFLWLWANPSEVRLLWRDGAGQPYNQLESGRRALESGGEKVVAIGNAGIYEPGLIPAGLHIEQGRELVPLNRRSGTGNFYLQPNGVLWIGDGRAAVDTTDIFAEKYAADSRQPDGARTVDGDRIDLAVQSGPMLVIDGVANPRFTPETTSTHIRNAVAVDAEGRVLLIISRQPINLRRMADKCIELGAVDALYLDGSISRLEQPVDGRPIFPNIPVAAMLAVVEP